MNAALHDGNGDAVDRANHKLAGMTDGSALRERREFRRTGCASSSRVRRRIHRGPSPAPRRSAGTERCAAKMNSAAWMARVKSSASDWGEKAVGICVRRLSVGTFAAPRPADCWLRGGLDSARKNCRRPRGLKSARGKIEMGQLDAGLKASSTRPNAKHYPKNVLGTLSHGLRA